MNRKVRSTVVLLLLLLYSLPAQAQTGYYRYYSSPDGSYSFQQFGNGYNYSMPRSGQFYYQGSPQDMNRIMQEFEQMFSNFFSQGQYPGGNFSGSIDMMPNMPNLNNSNSNSFVPSVPDVVPAPEYSEQPEIYY